jgi:aspartyl/asparaginyl beta-hydroxylase (cupin superfamily)
VIAAGPVDASVWLALAYAHRDLAEEDAKLAAVDKALALEPRNLRALLLKADHFAARGASREAASFYTAAVGAASQLAQVPPDLLPEVRRAEDYAARSAREYETFLRSRLAAQGFGAAASSRFAQSIDLLLGTKQLHLQQPRYYYFPELPQIQFYDRVRFPWMDAVEAATDAIRGELLTILEEEGAFTPYVRSDPNRAQIDRYGQMENPDWGAFHLYKNGVRQPENADRCPQTLAALQEAPLTQIKGRAPSVLFSMLRPGARIPPHTGVTNARLICHLPLIVPPGCALRVGNDTREWVEGRGWLFDDSIEHEAWNRSDRTRVILIFDVWKPELSEEERQMVAATFEAADAYGGFGGEWDA